MHRNIEPTPERIVAIREYISTLVSQGKSESSALDHASQYFGVHRSKLKAALGR